MISSTVHKEQEEEEGEEGEKEQEEEEREEEGIVENPNKQTMLSAVIDGLSVTKDVWGCGYAPTSKNSESNEINCIA